MYRHLERRASDGDGRMFGGSSNRRGSSSRSYDLMSNRNESLGQKKTEVVWWIGVGMRT